MRKCLAFLVIGFFFQHHSTLLGEVGQNISSESILDRLERRLIEKEKATLEYYELYKQKPQAKKAKKSIKHEKESVIKPLLPYKPKILKLNQAVNEIEIEIEHLSMDLKKLQNNILNELNSANFVKIAARVKNKELTTFRNLSIKLDGFIIYELNETTGLFMMQDTLALYEGPIGPGNHVLDFNARVIRRDEGKTINSVYNVINQRFKLFVPNGKFEKKWEIIIDTPKKDNFQMKAELKSVGLKHD